MTSTEENGLSEMQRVLRTKLAQRGVLKKLKAQIRAEMFAAMMNTSSSSKSEDDGRSENFVVNELVREYLSFNGYRQTLSVFTAEASINKTRPFDADFVAQEVGLGDEDGVDSETRKLPLIYQMIESLKTKRFEEKVGLVARESEEEDVEEEHYVDDLPRVRMLDSVPPPRSPAKSSVRSRRSGSPLSLRPPFR
jgi:lisH domain-containing protein FOPNL